MQLKILRSLQGIVVGWAVVVVLSHVAMENAAANEWRVISELRTQRGEFATAVVDGKIYLIGGTPFENLRGVARENELGIWQGPFGMSLVEVYDPETNTWQRLADIPTARSEPMTGVVDGKIYVLAGYIGKDNRGVNLKHLNVVEMYDPQTDTWVRKLAPMGIGFRILRGQDDDAVIVCDRPIKLTFFRMSSTPMGISIRVLRGQVYNFVIVLNRPIKIAFMNVQN